MALKSTIYKAALGVADMDRPYYGEHALTLARHPSETEQRLMIRLLAFALHADDRLEFGRGISADDEPALWLKEYSGEIRTWIEVGLPDERLLRRAAGRAGNVVVYAYGGKAMEMWRQKLSAEKSSPLWLRNLRVLTLRDEQSAALTALAERNMSLQCTVQDGQIWVTDGPSTVVIELQELTRECA
jgi:uncharacterized protein YaeQ